MVGSAGNSKIDRKALRLYKPNLRFAHDKFSQLEMDMPFELAKIPEDRGLPWTPYMLIFFKRVIDAGYVRIIRDTGISVSINGVDPAPAFIGITEKGRQFIIELGDHEL